jgi:hypothetical protein
VSGGRAEAGACAASDIRATALTLPRLHSLSAPFSVEITSGLVDAQLLLDAYLLHLCDSFPTRRQGMVLLRSPPYAHLGSWIFASS